MCITDVDDCNNIIINPLSLRDIISISRVNKRSYHNIKHNVLYKEITKIKSKNKIVKQMVKKGLLNLLIHVNGKMKGNVVYQAVKYGQIGILNWYNTTLTKPLKCNRVLTTVACEKGHVESLDWLYENTKFFLNTEAINTAINRNHVDVIEWFYNHGLLKCNKDYARFLFNNPNMLLWFIDHQLFKSTHKDIINILTYHKQNILTILHDKGYINGYYINVIKTYIKYTLNDIKHIEENKWLLWTRDHYIVYNDEDVRFLLRNNFLNIITILDENNMLETDMKEYIRNYTLNNPSIELITWGLSNQIAIIYMKKLLCIGI